MCPLQTEKKNVLALRGNVLSSQLEERKGRKEERVAIRKARPGLPNPDRMGQKNCSLPWLSPLKDVTS